MIHNTGIIGRERAMGKILNIIISRSSKIFTNAESLISILLLFKGFLCRLPQGLRSPLLE